MRPRPFLLLLAGIALALMAAGEADAEASHSPAEVDEGDTFLAWIDADEIYEEVKFYVCTLEEPYTCYAPQKMTREEADANGSYRYNFTHQVGDGVYPGYRYVLLEGENKTKVPASADDQYPGLEVVDLADSGSYYFKVERKAAPPTATIDSISPLPVRFDAEVTFSGTGSDSDGTVVAYEWTSSRDGFLSDEEDFSITGLTVGNHIISFRVQDNDGEWSNWSMAELYVYPNAPPVGTIDSIEPSPAEEGTTVFFDGTGSDSDGTVVAYQWESSIDGELSTEEDFSTSELSLGHHNITFQVQDNDGAWGGSYDGATASLYGSVIDVDGNSVEDVRVAASGQQTFTDGEGRYFLHNLTAGELKVTFFIPAYRTHSVWIDLRPAGINLLNAELAEGDGHDVEDQRSNDEMWSSSSSISLWIYAVPVAIAGGPVTVEAGKMVQLFGQGGDDDGNIALYEWDFDGNGIYDWSSEDNGIAEFRYSSEGTYNAVLRVTDNDGYSSTSTMTISVEPASRIGQIAGIEGKYILGAALLIAIGIATAGYLIRVR